MKIKKLLPEDVKGNLLVYKDYRKVIKPALKAMLTHLTMQKCGKQNLQMLKNLRGKN